MCGCGYKCQQMAKWFDHFSMTYIRQKKLIHLVTNSTVCFLFCFYHDRCLLTSITTTSQFFDFNDMQIKQQSINYRHLLINQRWELVLNIQYRNISHDQCECEWECECERRPSSISFTLWLCTLVWLDFFVIINHGR